MIDHSVINVFSLKAPPCNLIKLSILIMFDLAETQAEEPINFLEPELRESLRLDFEKVVTQTISPILRNRGDLNLRPTEPISEIYGPETDGAYWTVGKFESDALQVCQLSWGPFDNSIELTHLIIREKYRHQKLATAIYQALSVIALRLGANTVIVNYVIDERLKGFWESLGFVQDQLHPDKYVKHLGLI
jgi:GNAT superfamily N-acetyltransferase